MTERNGSINVNRPSRDAVEAVCDWVIGKIRANDEIAGGDVLYYYSEGRSVSFCDGEREENNSASSLCVGIRVMAADGRQGVACANDCSRASVAETLEWSLANCRAAEREGEVMLWSGKADYDASMLEREDPRIIAGVSQEERERVCAEMSGRAKARSSSVASVRAASWSDGMGEGCYASTAGTLAWSAATSASCGVSVVVGAGGTFETGGFGKSRRFAGDLRPDEYADRAVDDALMTLGGKPVPTGRYSLLLLPDITAQIADETGDLFCASDVQKGRSMMKGKLGERVAGSVFTLVDDARVPRMMASRMFDGEGVPTGRTVLIEGGVAKNYLYNLQYAARDGAVTTGSAARSASSLPDVATSNLLVSPGPDSRESIIGGIKKGIMISELMGMHTINPVSGEFSLGVKGVLIEDGRLCGPVSGVTIAGTLFELLGNVTAMGNDVEDFGSCRAPSMLVEGITVAGR